MTFLRYYCCVTGDKKREREKMLENDLNWPNLNGNNDSNRENNDENDTNGKNNSCNGENKKVRFNMSS